jgi:hypothetical protein
VSGSLLDWIDEAPKAAPPSATEPVSARGVQWPGGHSTAAVKSLAHGLEVQLAAAVFEEGDSASQALALVRAWRAALADHARHGRNWLTKYREELVPLLRVALPNLLPTPALEAILEGHDLLDLARRVFPDARQGPMTAIGAARPRVGHWR